MTDKCPVCGTEGEIQSSDEGTSYFTARDISEMWTMLRIFRSGIESGVYPVKGSECHKQLNDILKD